MVSEQVSTKSMTCGPDPQPVIDSIYQYIDAGYDHVYLHQIGPDQTGFLQFWTNELRPALDSSALVGAG
jgi:hypothetical protein